MKIAVEAKVELEVEIKDVLAFLIEEKLTAHQYDLIIIEAQRRKKGYFTMNDQAKYELFERAKENFTVEELEKRLS